MLKIRHFLLLSFLASMHSPSLTSKDLVYFSPDDHPTEKLINLIDNARDSIRAAVYMITDTKIATALINAKKRGVNIEIVIDRSSFDGSWGKGKYLNENNIRLFVFGLNAKPRTRFPSALMHNKFALIDNQLWNGSFNWTRNANKNNQENVILTDNRDLYKRFQKHFDILKNRSTAIVAKRKINRDRKPYLWQQARDLFGKFRNKLNAKTPEL